MGFVLIYSLFARQVVEPVKAWRAGVEPKRRLGKALTKEIATRTVSRTGPSFHGGARRFLFGGSRPALPSYQRAAGRYER